MNCKDLDLLTQSYDFDLPTQLIAQEALKKRSDSKLLVYKALSDQVSHHRFYELADILPSKSHLVFNQTKVFPCRLFGKKKTGGIAEVFFLSLEAKNDLYQVMIKSNGKKNIGDQFFIDDLTIIIVNSFEGSFWVSVNFSHDQLLDFFETHGQIPIPPYIREGKSNEEDKEQYQTVYAKKLGSVAAPTAGLHFDEKVFKSLAEKNINKSFVTLHVGMGTFKPVSALNIKDHHMHQEHFDIEESELKKINDHINHLIAVGTTTLRVLESSFKEGKIVLPSSQSTDIFLHPGVKVQSIKGLITNFHLPKSTLLMLVSSLIGREKALDLYKIAIAREYRFFSYGDSMLILRDQ